MEMAERRFALIIACNKYKDQKLKQLVAPNQDALALTEVLENPVIGNYKVRSLVDQPKREVEAAVNDFFSGRERDDLLLLYFSCHGIKDDAGRLFFATADTSLIEGLWPSAVEANKINEQMRNSGVKRQILLLDCCWSGAFAKGMVAKAGGHNVGTKEYFNEGRGRVVLTATDSMQYAFEGDKINGESVLSDFTRVLVDGLKTGEADVDQDGLVSFTDLCQYVAARVVAETLGRQKPQYWIFEGEGNIEIAKNPHYKPSYDHTIPFLEKHPSLGIFEKRASIALLKLDSYDTSNRRE